MKLRYDAKWLNKGAWVAAERQRTSANDLYGTVPVESGGTGADNAEEARANLGAAPAGFGFGDASIAEYYETGATDESKLEAWLDGLLDSMPNNTCRQVNITLRPILPGTEYFGTLFKSEGRNKAVLRATCYGGDEIVKTYSLRGEWKWDAIMFVNPQMMIGVEYRTTDQHLGRPVYRKAVNIGTMPNATSMTVQHGIENMEYALSVNGSMRHTAGNNVVSIPYYESEANYIGISLQQTVVKVTSKADSSAFSGVVHLKYIKTVD